MSEKSPLISKGKETLAKAYMPILWIMLLQVVVGWVSTLVNDVMPFATIFTVVILLLIGIIGTVAVSAILVNDASFGESVMFGIKNFYKIIPSAILVALLTIGGLVLFIIPGIIIIIKTAFFPFVWIENQDKGAWWIVKKSMRSTKGKTFWTVLMIMFLFSLFAGFLDIFGRMAAPLTAIITMAVAPIPVVAYYTLYKRSAKKHNDENAENTENEKSIEGGSQQNTESESQQ